MPANLPAEAKHKWAKISTVKNPREKLELLKEFFSLIPKHKGTAKLCVQVKRQMAKLRVEIEEEKRRKIRKGRSKFTIQKEGAAQIAILGLTNVGKSSLLKAITNAKVEISANPYTTQEPRPGIFVYKDLQFQIVEAPALMQGSADGRAWGLQTLALARNADGLFLMVDLSQDHVNQLSIILRELEKSRILISKPKAHVKIKRKTAGMGLRLVLTGKLVDCTTKDVTQLLQRHHFTDAVVAIQGEATLQDVEDAIFESAVFKPALIVANKIDVKGSETNLRLLQSCAKNIGLPIIQVSCQKEIGLNKLGETLVKQLNYIRVYTKDPTQKKFSNKPFVFKKGAKVMDLTQNIHSDFRVKFRYAKIWAKRLAFSPQKCGLNFVLEDGDIVEIHVKD